MGIPDEDIHSHATGAAAHTVQAHSKPSELLFHGSWFCPFVQVSLTFNNHLYRYSASSTNKQDT